jgi:uncharacterized protein involved in type VI secretion and phage assembly
VTTGLVDAVARIARHEAAARATAAVGVVTGVHPADAARKDHAVTVRLRDTGLVLPNVPIAVGVLGFAAIPAVDDLVLVVFADGDRHAPFVVGRLYHPDADAPEHAEGQAVLRLPAGNGTPTLELVVEGDPPKVELTLPKDVKVEIAEGVVRIAVGDLTASLDSAGGGRVEVAAGGSSVTLKKDGDVTVKAAGNLVLEGTEVRVKGSAKVVVQGAMVEIN